MHQWLCLEERVSLPTSYGFAFGIMLEDAVSIGARGLR